MNPLAGWLAAFVFAAGATILAYGGLAALGGVCLVLLVAGLAWGRVYILGRSLAAIDDAAHRIAQGDRSVRVSSPSGCAWTASVVDRFNMMSASLDDNAQQRHVATASISHEIRTPLTILKGRLHAIEDGVIDLEMQEMQRLLRQVDHILRIVDDLDTLGKVDDGTLPLNLEMVDLQQIIAPAVSDLGPLVERHGLRIRQATRPTMVLGDPVRLTQIVTNLVTNAAKHSQPDAEVNVSVHSLGDRAVICVLDAGPGFTEADRDRLFQPFWRSDADVRSGCPGRGIGLTLTASLVRAHGGHLSAENRRDRPGACFSVILPLAA